MEQDSTNAKSSVDYAVVCVSPRKPNAATGIDDISVGGTVRLSAPIEIQADLFPS